MVAARAGDSERLAEWASAGGNVDGPLDPVSTASHQLPRLTVSRKLIADARSWRAVGAARWQVPSRRSRAPTVGLAAPRAGPSEPHGDSMLRKQPSPVCQQHCFCPPSSQELAGWTPLHFVAADGNAKACAALLASGADAAAKTPGDGFTAVHLAARFGHAGAVRALLQAGAVVDELDAYGHTALHFAAGFGHEAAASELVGFGAEAGAKDGRGGTPAEAARARGFEAVLAVVEAAAGRGRDERGRLLDWLRAIGLEGRYTALLEQGFDDIRFIADAGMSEADCDAVGVTLAGHRKKLTSLYRIREFLGEQEEPKPEPEEAEEEEDDDEEDDESDEDGSDDDDDDDDDE